MRLYVCMKHLKVQEPYCNSVNYNLVDHMADCLVMRLWLPISVGMCSYSCCNDSPVNAGDQFHFYMTHTQTDVVRHQLIICVSHLIRPKEQQTPDRTLSSITKIVRAPTLYPVHSIG